MLQEDARAAVLADYSKKWKMPVADVEAMFASGNMDTEAFDRDIEQLMSPKKKLYAERPVVVQITSGVRSIDSVQLPLRFRAVWKVLHRLAGQDPRRIAVTTLGNLARAATRLVGERVSVPPPPAPRA